MRQTIEQSQISAEAEFKRDVSDYDETFVQSVKVMLVADETLLELKELIAADRPPDWVTQEYINELEAAHHCGEKLLENMDEVKYDMSKANDELLRELRGTIAYIAPHFGIHVPLPGQENTQ
jgi:hypothetical protein